MNIHERIPENANRVNEVVREVKIQNTSITVHLLQEKMSVIIVNAEVEGSQTVVHLLTDPEMERKGEVKAEKEVAVMNPEVGDGTKTDLHTMEVQVVVETHLRIPDVMTA